MINITKKYRSLLICIILALVTLAVYARVFTCDFINFDDNLYVTDNSHIQSGLTWQSIKWAFTTNQAYNWHPMVWISHMLDCRLYGLNPLGHHLTNLLFHIINTLLLFLVFKSMTGQIWPSAFIAALFALHPVHVESVAWVSERKDVLSTFFWLVTMWFYVRYVRRQSFATYLPVMISLALGLMAKQMLVTLPFVLLLLDYWPLNRFGKNQPKNSNKATMKTALFLHCFREKIPLLFLSAVASLVVLLVQSEATLVKLIPFKYRLGNALVAYAKYIIKMFWPSRLGILYPHPGSALPTWQVIAAVCILLLISIAVILAGRRHKYLFVGWFWFIGTLVPVIGLVQVGLQAMADRYTYVPLIGLFIIIAWGTADIFGKPRYKTIVPVSAAIVILSVLSGLTWIQVGHWQNSFTLFEHTAAVTNNNDIMHYNLGSMYLREGKTDEAIKHYSESVKIKPDQPTIHSNLAILYGRQGKYDKAIEHYQEVLKYRPDDKTAYEAIRALEKMQNKSPTP